MTDTTGKEAKPEAPITGAAPAEKEDKEEGPEGEGGEEVHYESTAVFTPVVQLAEVETKTHEEDEDVVYKQRGKLFVFGEAMLDKGSGKKSWLERGIGDVKILRHRGNMRHRVLMRQEKTMKVIANHMLDPRIVMQPNVGSDRSWVWTAYDFSEGELREEVFALKFGKPQDAEEFKKAFETAKEEMRQFVETVEEEPQREGDAAAAADAADAFASLKLDKKTDASAGEAKTD